MQFIFYESHPSLLYFLQMSITLVFKMTHAYDGWDARERVKTGHTIMWRAQITDELERI